MVNGQRLRRSFEAVSRNMLRLKSRGLFQIQVNSYMVKHIILWKLRSELSAEEKQAKALAIKQGLEGLQGKVPGLVDIHVQIDGRLDSSNADIMLDSTLESEAALKGYAVHPAHVAVADGVVRPNTELRTCLDFEY